ncbi:hypothetical protein MLD38_024217 [Melastoma candidum]|nr:hypothetical protein MLD38_024217 [Melastoma candidum]
MAFQPPAWGKDYTILQALFSIDMLILFLTMMCGAGGTLTAIDNLGQIGKSLGYQKSSIRTFISLVSIWNYLGRVVSGFASEILLTKYGLPRPLILTTNLLLLCTGHLLIAFDIPNGLYIASIILGFGCGVQWPLFFAIISEIFGLRNYAMLYNLGSMSCPIGLFLLNVKVTGNLYDKEAMRQMVKMGVTRKAGEDLNCSGAKCFQRAFLIITVVTLVSALVSSVLVVRTREFYRIEFHKKCKEEAEDREARTASET